MSDMKDDLKSVLKILLQTKMPNNEAFRAGDSNDANLIDDNNYSKRRTDRFQNISRLSELAM